MPSTGEAPRGPVAPPILPRPAIPKLSDAALHHFLTKATNWETPNPKPPPLRFDYTQAAAAHNDQVLSKFDYDLAALLA